VKVRAGEPIVGGEDSAEEIERVADRLQAGRGGLADAMVAAMRAEIPAYARAGKELLADIRAHAEAHAQRIIEVARVDTLPSWEEFEFAREAAARRSRQGVPLDELLHAFRVGHRTVWDAIVAEASDSKAGREAAIALARPALQYVDLSSTLVAEAYLREEQRLLATADRERRDLLENLLAGRTALPEAPGVPASLRGSPELVVAVVRALGQEDSGSDELHEVAATLCAHAARGAVEPLVVERQGEVVGVMGADSPNPAEALGSAARALAREAGITIRAGISSHGTGLDSVARGYAEAGRALERTTAERPVVALGEMRPFEYVLASADAATARVIAAKGRRLLDADRDGTVIETLLAYAAADLNVSEAARRLVVHPNTVRYRLRRISELTGSDTQSFEELVDLLTVIRMARVSG